MDTNQVSIDGGGYISYESIFLSKGIIFINKTKFILML